MLTEIIKLQKTPVQRVCVSFIIVIMFYKFCFIFYSCMYLRDFIFDFQNRVVIGIFLDTPFVVLCVFKV